MFSVSQPRGKLTRVVFYLAIGFSLVIFSGKHIPLQAQTLRPTEVAEIAYQQLPNFPKENQYLNQDNNQVDRDNTLISRLVAYHQYVKNRPTGFRLDWKLTLADYLGAHETIIAEGYPGSKTLVTNPLSGDLAAIRNLNLAQRNQLVAVLMAIYNPVSETPTAPEEAQPSNNSQPSLPLPKPGDAELLLP